MQPCTTSAEVDAAELRLSLMAGLYESVLETTLNGLFLWPCARNTFPLRWAS